LFFCLLVYSIIHFT